MARNQTPRYLLTKEGHVWVVCKVCRDAVPVWQTDDDGERETFKCCFCRKETFKGDAKLPVPGFVNAPKFKQPSQQKNYMKLKEGGYQFVEAVQ